MINEQILNNTELFQNIFFLSSIFIFFTKNIYKNNNFINIYGTLDVSILLGLLFCLISFVDLVDSFTDYNTIFFITIIFIISNFFVQVYFLNISVLQSLQNDTVIILNFILFFAYALFSNYDDFVFFLINLEGLSLSLYLLAATGRNIGGIIAAVKYFIFGTLGSIFLYWGSVTIFELIGSADLTTLNFLFIQFNLYPNSLSTYMYYKLIYISSLIIIGLLIKLGAAPTHQWVIDVYSGVPLYITLYYSILIKFMLFNLYFNLASILTTNTEIEYAAFFSLLIGSIGTLQQTRIKRFLAYSSITHTGFLLMGDFMSANIYLMTYVLSSLLFFSVLLSNNKSGSELVYLTDLRYLNTKDQSSKIYLSLALLSMAGIPPLAGFYGKFYIWLSLIEDIFLFNDCWSFILLTTNLVTSLLIIFYYIRLITYIYSSNDYVSATIKNNSINFSFFF